MTGRVTLSVVVQELGPGDFIWTLKRKQSSTGLVESIAASPGHFSEYDQALDAGFVALHETAYAAAQRAGLDTGIYSRCLPVDGGTAASGSVRSEIQSTPQGESNIETSAAPTDSRDI